MAKGRKRTTAPEAKSKDFLDMIAPSVIKFSTDHIIDVGAKFEIYALMNELLSKGFAIIMISSEMQEIQGMSDRIITFYEGKVTGDVLNDGTYSQEDIMVLATGGNLT